MSDSEPLEGRFFWVNHPWAGSILVLCLLALSVVVALLFMRNVPDFGPCGPAAACSVSNAPGP
jgi:hypothetical protein